MKLTFGSDFLKIRLFARCGINGCGSRAPLELINCYAFNQYDVRKSKTPDWFKLFGSKPTHCTETAFRSNSFQVARWACQSMLAGVKSVRVGFVAREKPQVCFFL